MMYNNSQGYVAVPQLQYQLIQINVNNPHYVPNINMPDHIRPYAAYISGMLMDCIQNKSADNALRIAAFNATASNAFQNNEFNFLYEVAIRFITALASSPSGQGMAVQSLISSGVETAVVLYISKLVHDNPALQSYAGPDQARELVKNYEMLSNLFTLGNSQMSQGFSQNQIQNSYQYQQQVHQQQTTSTAIGSRMGMGDTSQLSSAFSHNSFTPTNLAFPKNKPTTTDRYSSYLNNSAPKEQVEIGDFKTNATVVANQPKIPDMEIKNSPLKWSRSERQPHYPTFNVNTSRVDVVENNGDFLAQVIPIEDGDNYVFDYDEHRTRFDYYPLDRKFNPNSYIEKNKATLEALRNEKLDVEIDRPIETVEVRRYVLNNNVGIVANLDSLVEEHLESLYETNIPGSGVLAMYQTYHYIQRNLFTHSEKEEKAIEMLSTLKSLGTIKAFLLENQNDISVSNYRRINGTITEAINRYCRNELSVPFKIDRFDKDYDDLVKALEDESPVLADAFKRDQANFIAKYLTLAKTLIDEGEEEAIWSIRQAASIVSINEEFHELNTGLMKDDAYGSVIFPSETPILHGIASAIFNDDESEFDNEKTQYYILTKDHVILSLTFSLMMEQTYLVQKQPDLF